MAVPASAELSVGEFKARIAQTLPPDPATGARLFPQLLVFRGKMLTDKEATLGACGLHEGAEVQRFVVYAYARDGTPARVLGLTGVSRETLRRILGSLRFTPGSAASAIRCSPDRDSLS